MGGFIRYPIGYAVVARLLPEMLIKLSIDKWLANHAFFHFYGHTFEFASSQPSTFYALNSVSGSFTMLLYSLRCLERDKLFHSILSRCHFQSIEQVLFGATHDLELG
jgi:hypothetical protein